ncbi:MAG: hypothetical protein AABO58_12010 [Acidobacteriota bacterium]
MDINDGRQKTRASERRSRKVPLLQPGERTAVRALFLHGAESYGLGEAARLLGMSPAALKREAEEDRAEEYRSGRVWRFTWRQVACIALRRWTLAEIQDTLGEDAATALPPLLALRSVTVRLPEYILRTLETLATAERTTLDAYLYRELVEFAGTWAEEMEAVHPGFRRAYFYPGRA